TPAVQVQILNPNICVVNISGNVSLATGANPSGGILSGTTTHPAAGGIATFNNLRIDKAGNGYTLAASSGILTGTSSNSFNITCPAITLGTLSAGTVNSAYNQTVTASGGSGTYTFEATPA